MPEETRTLEMRVAELEDKLSRLTAQQPSPTIPQVCGCSVCVACATCFHCIIAQCIIRQCIFECTCGPCAACTPQLMSTTMGGMGGFGGLGR